MRKMKLKNILEQQERNGKYYSGWLYCRFKVNKTHYFPYELLHTTNGTDYSKQANSSIVTVFKEKKFST